MTRPVALLDSNVIVAALAPGHPDHPVSSDVLASAKSIGIGIAAHSFSEVFNTLTRRGERYPYRVPPAAAVNLLETVRKATTLVGLTPAQTYDVMLEFARLGGVGARLYDYLIGRAAVAAGVDTIVTWNTGHFGALFPAMRVITPADWSFDGPRT